MATGISGPIPGESLTREKGNSPWEQPPKYARVDEALKYYIENLEDDEVLEDIFSALDAGCPLDLLIDSLLLSGEMRGLHTPDTSMIIGPVLHEWVMGLAESADIHVIEFQSDLNKPEYSDRDYQMFSTMFDKSLQDNSSKSDFEGALEALPEAAERAEEGEGYSNPEDGDSDSEDLPEAPEGTDTPNPPSGLIARP